MAHKGCCDTIILSSTGNAAKVQDYRFGEYTMFSKTPNTSNFIYLYKHGTERSTLIKDLKKGEWGVYNGELTTPKVGSRVIKSGCTTECVNSCTSTIWEYLDGDNFTPDETIKVNCGSGIELLPILLGLLGGLIILGLIVVALIFWYRRNGGKKPRVSKDFTVLINDRGKIEKTIMLPDDEYILTASCQLVSLDIEEQALAYKYSWVNSRNPQHILGEEAEYTAKGLQQGNHEYIVTVICGEWTHESTATVIVDSGATVERMKIKEQYMGVRAAVGQHIWLNSPKKITTLPKILIGSVLFPVHNPMQQIESDIKITVKEPSTVYIARITQDSDSESRSRRGWGTTYLNSKGFTYVENEKVETDYRLHDTVTCSLSLYTKTLAKGDMFPFARTETEQSVVAIFVKKGH